MPRVAEGAASEAGDASVGWREVAWVLSGYGALAALHLWPLLGRAATHSMRYPDTWVNLWSLNFVARQAAVDLANLFDANAYWPQSGALAYAESLLPQSAQAAPLLWLGAGPVLAHNLVLLLTFPLCGLGAYLLARQLGVTAAAAALAGYVYAFNPFRWQHLVQIHHVSTQWLPFALLFFLMAVRSGRPRHLLLLGATSLLQALSSGYYAVMLAPAFAVALAFSWREAVARRTLWRVLAALGLAAVATFAAYEPQREVQERHGFTRQREHLLGWSARWPSFLEPGDMQAAPHLRWLHERVADAEPLFLGSLPLMAAAGSLVLVRKREVRWALVLAATGVALALGPEIRLGPLVMPGPVEFFRSLPGVSGLRTPVRMVILAQLGIGLAAGLALSSLPGTERLRRGVAAAVLAFTAWEMHPGELASRIERVPAPPASAHFLASAPRGPVLELPWLTYEDSALYLYWSTVHWQPMVNGYGAFEPPQNRAWGGLGSLIPREHACRRLGEVGVRWVVIHEERIRPGQARRLREEPMCPTARTAFTWSGGRVLELLRPGS